MSKNSFPKTGIYFFCDASSEQCFRVVTVDGNLKKEAPEW